MDDEQESAWFILVERENTPSKLIGPYNEEANAIKEMEEGLYVESLAQEDALEIMVVELPIAKVDLMEHSIVYELPPEYQEPGESGIGVFFYGPQETIEGEVNVG